MSPDFKPSARKDEWLRVAWLAFLSVAAYLLFIPPETVTAIAVPPDSSEYAVGLVNLFEHGTFGLTLNGTWYPSRFAPWFSVLCLTPAYFLGGGNALCLNWAILGFALAMLVLLGVWSRKAGLGRWASLGVAALPLFLPDFVFYSRVVMTEIPYAAIFAASALVFLRLADGRRAPSFLLCLGAGAVVAWGGAVRPTLLPMLLPFAVVIAFFTDGTGRRRLLRLAALVMPVVCYELLNLGYNWAVFGSPTRSGYQYWMPVPCDYPGLLFSLDNLLPNVKALLAAPVMQITLVFLACSLAYAGAVLAGRFGGARANRAYLLLTAFLAFQAAVLAALYLGYFWKDTRFFLPVTLCSAPLFLAAVSRVLAVRPGFASRTAFALVFVLCAVSCLSSPTRYYTMLHWRQYWHEKAKVSARVLPAGSAVIQDGDPNVLDHFGFRERGLQVIPFARRFDYVIHMVAPKSVRGVKPQPATAMPMIRPEFVAEGLCRLPFATTFDEDPGVVARHLAEGRRVFLEQEVLRGESGWEPFQRKLRERGLASRFAGTWQTEGTSPDPLRHGYDELLFGRDSADRVPGVQVTYHEIVATGGAQAK